MFWNALLTSEMNIDYVYLFIYVFFSSTWMQIFLFDLVAMMTNCDHDLLVWIDLEMSGLDLKIHTIVEIAVAITDFQLQHFVEGEINGWWS